jgi:hypothetical protein
MVINHLCRNKSCVNAGHMEVTTNSGNTLHPASLSPARINKDKTHCKRGHALTPDNIYIQPGKYGVQRICRTCARAYWKAYEAKSSVVKASLMPE